VLTVLNISGSDDHKRSQTDEHDYDINLEIVFVYWYDDDNNNDHNNHKYNNNNNIII
jgi:hypothetical protein